MDIQQLALAVVNDRTTEAARSRALEVFIEKGADHWDAAVHWLLPAVILERRKPIYEGVQFSGSPWQAASAVLEMEIQRAIDERESSSC